MAAPGIYRWSAEGLEAARGPGILLVADSFLVEAGHVVALERHRARFLASLRDPVIAAVAGGPLPEPGQAELFWDAAIAALPRIGLWFPRLELVTIDGVPEFRLRLRESPRLDRSVTLQTHSAPDPRRVPGIKGPDLERLLRLRADAQRNGAGEAVLLSADGHVLDCCASALVWWRGDTLCTPPADAPRVDSVTVRTLLDLAARAGVSIVEELRRPADLDGLEVWALNALHGIRVVDHWRHGPRPVARPWRAGEWRGRLRSTRRLLPGD
jgi:branched-subunit amino acid aminotransferase/4-amino-4-deoxychorismate lyase